jgi:hypothetical protein
MKVFVLFEELGVRLSEEALAKSRSMIEIGGKLVKIKKT